MRLEDRTDYHFRFDVRVRGLNFSFDGLAPSSDSESEDNA